MYIKRKYFLRLMGVVLTIYLALHFSQDKLPLTLITGNQRDTKLSLQEIVEEEQEWWESNEDEEEYYDEQMKQYLDKQDTQETTKTQEGQNNATITSLKAANQNVCSQEQRHAQLYAHCPRQPSLDDIDSMTDEEIETMSRWFLVAERLKTITCMHYKVGWTSQRLILLNNSADNPTRPVHAPDGKGQFAGLNHVNITYMHKSGWTIEEKRYRMKNYFKYTFVRHPFDRILSAYMDKLVVEMDPKYEHTGDYYQVMIPRILRKIKPDLLSQPLESIRLSFSDVIDFIVKGGFDWHFKGTYNDVCMHCKFKYDYIGKVETWDHDMDYIIDNHFPYKRGKRTKGNVNSEISDVYHKRLKEYEDIQEDHMAYMKRKYKDDFDMFGYKLEEKNGEMYASCDGECC